MPKLRCNVTNTFWSVTTNHKRELIEQYGSEEDLNSKYVCRTARRLRKEGKTDAEIREMADNGEIVSKTSPPKRLNKTAGTSTKSAKTVAVKPAPKKEKVSDDPDVNAFLAPIEEDQPEATGKAV